MVLMSVLILEFLLLAEALRRVDRLCAAVLCSIYIMLGQIYMQYRSSSFFDHRFPPGNFGEFYFHPDKWTVFFLGVFFVIYGSTFGLRNARKTITLNDAARNFIGTPIVKHSYVILALLLFVRFCTIDIGVLWKNNQYLLINSVESLDYDNPITRLAKALTSIAALLAGFSLGGDIVARQGKRVIVGLVLVGVYLLFPIASASRSAVLPMASISLCLICIGNRKHVIPAVLAGIMGMVFFVMAQMARSTGEYGISVIPNYLKLLSHASFDDLIRMTVGSISQGFFITPDSIAFDAEHPIQYKLLSFSPMPSAIDGFSSILPLYEVRLHAFVPMSAVGEAFQFGLPYVVLFFLTVVVALRLNIKAANKENRILFVVTSALVTVFFINSFTYPMRNVYRNILVVIVILSAGKFLSYVWVFLPKKPKRSSRLMNQTRILNLSGDKID
ncbi:hypothetical protein [Mangrovicoccus sp. HB161399]|uniref:hypothetical protein n=1 Tax=Mangrovicoccus sp. HB161399 TaxID=2720392 RepID=UPI0015525DE9|nr:hypothetical protein [Mangrovicoccus sp. HB161399]